MSKRRKFKARVAIQAMLNAHKPTSDRGKPCNHSNNASRTGACMAFEKIGVGIRPCNRWSLVKHTHHSLPSKEGNRHVLTTIAFTCKHLSSGGGASCHATVI